ncbi:MAG: hypothetical protein E4H17_03820 [Gemmatimonadales bacterium]|nr:MAG: hypothetical protein E4H17_03820 [Gemmatimonadales bacterium]
MGTNKRTARQVMAGLVTAGAAMAAIGATSLDVQVATVLPSIGAALVAAGIITLLQAESLASNRAIVVGAVLVAAGVVVAVTGSIVTDAAAANALVPTGGAMVAAGIISAVSGASALSSRARPHAA